MPYRVSLFLLVSAKISCCRTQAWTAARTPHGPPWGKMGHSMSKNTAGCWGKPLGAPTQPKAILSSLSLTARTVQCSLWLWGFVQAKENQGFEVFLWLLPIFPKKTKTSIMSKEMWGFIEIWDIWTKILLIPTEFNFQKGIKSECFPRAENKPCSCTSPQQPPSASLHKDFRVQQSSLHLRSSLSPSD